MNNESLKVGSTFIITKGCQTLNLQKGQIGRIIEVTEMGADYSHQVKVGIEIQSSRKTAKVRWSLYATHKNRLSDDETALLGSVSGQRVRVRPFQKTVKVTPANMDRFDAIIEDAPVAGSAPAEAQQVSTSPEATPPTGKEEAWRIEKAVKTGLFLEYEVTNNPKADMCFAIAWEMGHASGIDEVASYFEMLVELIKPSRIWTGEINGKKVRIRKPAPRVGVVEEQSENGEWQAIDNDAECAVVYQTAFLEVS